MMKKKWSTQMLVEAGIMISLAFILSNIRLYKMPQGGSVTAGSMIPIILFSLRWGVGPGMTAGAVLGVLKLMIGGYIFSIPQVILEYPVAFGVLGLSGIFKDGLDRARDGKYFKIVLGSFLGIFARFLCHFFAGVVFFGEFAEGISPVKHSLVYNMSYLVPEFIITFVIISIIWKPMENAKVLRKADI